MQSSVNIAEEAGRAKKPNKPKEPKVTDNVDKLSPEHLESNTSGERDAKERVRTHKQNGSIGMHDPAAQQFLFMRRNGWSPPQ